MLALKILALAKDKLKRIALFNSNLAIHEHR